jgi:hypothetical protein
MIEQDVNEVANAMEADPVRWARDYLELKELLDKLETQLGLSKGGLH